MYATRLRGSEGISHCEDTAQSHKNSLHGRLLVTTFKLALLAPAPPPNNNDERREENKHRLGDVVRSCHEPFREPPSTFQSEGRKTLRLVFVKLLTAP